MAKTTHELIMLASMMPYPMLLEKIIESASDTLRTGKKTDKDVLAMYSHMYVLKHLMDEEKKTVVELIQEIDSMKESVEHMKEIANLTKK